MLGLTWTCRVQASQQHHQEVDQGLPLHGQELRYIVLTGGTCQTIYDGPWHRHSDPPWATQDITAVLIFPHRSFSSCGSLKSRQGVGSGFWDILSDKSAPITILSQREVKAGSGVPKPGELTLTLTSVSAPLSLLHLQSGTSRSISWYEQWTHPLVN